LKLNVPTGTVCCYPAQPGFVAAAARMIAPVFIEAKSHGLPRLLLSAHGLPERVVRDGDPYQFQCEATAKAIVAQLAAMGLPVPADDWIVCYQSRVGPLKWIGPATDEEIRRAGNDGRPIVIAPIAFVSDHSETLVEIEIEYRKLAAEAGVPAFFRVSAVGAASEFIAGLAAAVEGASRGHIRSACGERVCPSDFVRCPMREK
jgi:ferrochelatase